MEGALTAPPARPDVVMLGAGNVATHLARALSAAGCRIVQVYSRTMASATRLAAETGARATDTTDLIYPGADLYIVAVPDDAIPPLASRLGRRRGAWVHTSGSTSMDALAGISPEAHGVFYPMQTFSREAAIDMAAVPLFTEASTPALLDWLDGVGRLITPRVAHADSTRRRQLHIAAVFACNFTNYLWGFSVDILENAGIPFDVMEPLIRATLDKALAIGPDAGQTGPARRGDTMTMDRHMDMLDGEARKVYALLSDSILKKYSSHATDEQNRL